MFCVFLLYSRDALKMEHVAIFLIVVIKYFPVREITYILAERY
jgi:hypothetical protein